MKQYTLNEETFKIRLDISDKKLLKVVKIMDKTDSYNNMLCYYNIYAVFDDLTTTFILTDSFDNKIKEYEPNRSVIFEILQDIHSIEKNKRKQV